MMAKISTVQETAQVLNRNTELTGYKSIRNNYVQFIIDAVANLL